MKNLAIIPARSGSKGLKDKNIKPLNGKPLIWHSIQAAIKSKCFEEVMVSTDSKKYAEIAMECGASVPFLRSKKTSMDNASSWDAVKEVLNNYRDLGITFDSVMLLQPTSPLRSVDDIKNAFKTMKAKNADSVVSVCEADHSPLLCNTLSKDGNMLNFINPRIVNKTQRQKLPKYYWTSGSIYLIKLKNNKFSIYGKNCYALKVPRIRSIDIDDSLDFEMAEFILKNKKL